MFLSMSLVVLLHIRLLVINYVVSLVLVVYMKLFLILVKSPLLHAYHKL